MIRTRKNDTEFISCLQGEQTGDENRSGVPLKCFEHQERELPVKNLEEEYKSGVSGQTRERDCENNSGEVCIALKL